MNGENKSQYGSYMFVCCGKDCSSHVSVMGRTKKEAVKNLVKVLGWLYVSPTLMYCDTCKNLLK